MRSVLKTDETCRDGLNVRNTGKNGRGRHCFTRSPQERPDVRWRRIKKIEADLRKAEKTIAQSQKYLTMWRAESLDLNMAKLISSHDHISACFPLDTYPRPAEKSQYEGSRSLWSALDDDIITTEQAREIAIRCHERQIQHQQRWVNHYQNRLIYERLCWTKAPPGVAEYVNNGGKHHAICETCHSER